MIVLPTIGLPHSDICGSSLVCKSPQLFAAYHVLRRLQEPRHPPYALFYFLLLAIPKIPIAEYSKYGAYLYLISLNHVNELFDSLPKNRNFVDHVEDKGVEPLTPCLQSRCSSQLS